MRLATDCLWWNGCHLQHMQRLHVSVQQDKRNQVLDLIQSVYEISLSVCVFC